MLWKYGKSPSWRSLVLTLLGRNLLQRNHVIQTPSVFEGPLFFLAAYSMFGGGRKETLGQQHRACLWPETRAIIESEAVKSDLCRFGTHSWDFDL
jgi:hypothetical protein